MFYIQWHITDRCNLRCLHCYQEQYTKSNELSWSELRLICDNVLTTMKLWDKRLKIALTGGEPFLKPELWEMLNYLSRSEYVASLSLITNGTLIDSSIINEMTQFHKLKEIYISLDGITAFTNDAIRGLGSFKRVGKGIRLLKSSGLSVIIMFTLLKSNIKDAMGLFKFSQSMGVTGYIIERFFPLGQGKEKLDEVVSAKDLDKLYQHIFNSINETYLPEEMIKYRAIYVNISCKERNMKILASPRLFRRYNLYYQGEPLVYGAECIAGRDGMAILPNGFVLPCRRFNLPIANLLEEPLSEIWKKSEVLNNIRDKENLKGKCGKCKIGDCYGCRAMTLALTGDYLAEDPHCFLKN